LQAHKTNSFAVSDEESRTAAHARETGQPVGRFTGVHADAESLCIPLVRPEGVLGVLVLRLPPATAQFTSAGHALINGFAAQIALLIEREKLRSASEREKLLAESDRLHRTLFDSVSHELKTPLSVLRSASEKLDTSDPLKRFDLIAEMRQAIIRLDHLVANLLNQSRLESGALKPHLDWCEARDLVGAARRAVGSVLAGRSLTVEIPPDMPLFMADAPLMEEVLSNLLLNAAIHTPRECRITIVAGVDQERSKVFIAVSDNGRGIPSELRPNLFQKFRRGNTARIGGLGLGLSIVRGFVLAQGGDVSVGDSTEGGARFTVRLPHAVHGTIPNDEH
jgi:two-component system sensor histidine kinase KdpD